MVGARIAVLAARLGGLLLRHDLVAVAGAGGEDAMIADEIDPGWRHEGGEFFQQLMGRDTVHGGGGEGGQQGLLVGEGIGLGIVEQAAFGAQPDDATSRGLDDLPQ